MEKITDFFKNLYDKKADFFSEMTLSDCYLWIIIIAVVVIAVIIWILSMKRINKKKQ